MDFTIGKFFAALSVTFSLFMLFGHDSSTDAGSSRQGAVTVSAIAGSSARPEIGAAQPSSHHHAPGQGKLMADSQSVGSR